MGRIHLGDAGGPTARQMWTSRHLEQRTGCALTEAPAENRCLSYGQIQNGQFQEFMRLTMIMIFPGKKRSPAS